MAHRRYSERSTSSRGSTRRAGRQPISRAAATATLAAGGHGNISSQRWRNQLSATYLRSDGYQRSKAGSLNSDYRTAKAFYQGQYDDPNVALRWQAGLSSKDYGSNTDDSARFDDQFEHTLKTFLSLKGESLKRTTPLPSSHLLEPPGRLTRTDTRVGGESALQLPPHGGLRTQPQRLLRLDAGAHGSSEQRCATRTSSAPPGRPARQEARHPRDRALLHQRPQPHQSPAFPGTQHRPRTALRLGRTDGGEEHAGRHGLASLSRPRREPEAGQPLAGVRQLQHLAQNAVFHGTLLLRRGT